MALAVLSGHHFDRLYLLHNGPPTCYGDVRWSVVICSMSDADESAMTTLPANMSELTEAMVRTYADQVAATAAEPARLARVYGSYFLRATQTSQLEAICRTAASVTSVQAAEINLLTDTRQVTIAQYGSVHDKEMPIKSSFCQYGLINNEEPMRIDDTLKSALLCSMEATTEHGVRSYLGIPLITREHRLLGSLCVYDCKPRTWVEQDVMVLTALAAQVMMLEEHEQA